MLLIPIKCLCQIVSLVSPEAACAPSSPLLSGYITSRISKLFNASLGKIIYSQEQLLLLSEYKCIELLLLPAVNRRIYLCIKIQAITSQSFLTELNRELSTLSVFTGSTHFCLSPLSKLPLEKNRNYTCFSFANSCLP